MRRSLRGAVVLGLALAACSPEERADPLPPTDRFYFPTGVATVPVTGGTALLVASSNFDLRYSAVDGGTLLSVLDDGAVPAGALSPAGAEPIGSYAGTVAVARCATLPKPVALVASRYDDVLYGFQVETVGGAGVTPGALTCGTGCVRPLDGRPQDPYGITVACRADGAKAYVGFLETPDSTRGSGRGAWIAQVNLQSATEPPRFVEVGDGPVRSMAYEEAADRLWIAARPSDERAYLYSVALGDPTWQGSSPWEAVDAVDLFPAVRGVELRSLAVGAPIAGLPRRLYATARLYDVEAQASNHSRPSGDVGGVLLVLDVTDGSDGRPVVVVHRVVSIGPGIGDVALIARSGRREVAVVSELDGDLLYVYDAEDDAMAIVLGRDSLGNPLLGDRPMALAVEQAAPDAPATVYVASFGDHLVTRFVIDPADLSLPLTLKTLGGLEP